MLHPFYKKNVNTNLNNEHLIRLKDMFTKHYNTPFDYKKMEDEVISSIINERHIVPIQMRKLDKNQYELDETANSSPSNNKETNHSTYTEGIKK